MSFSMKIVPFAVASLLAGAAQADGYTYSPWLNAIGATKAIQSQSLGGQGMILGIVDTGIIATNSEVAGRVLSTSSCASVTFSCAKGIVDDLGHGTAVASIAAGGVVNTAGISMVGVAPQASLLIEKAFINGQATNGDYVNAIKKATDGGASVINISGTYTYAANVVDAINYAASKGVFVVFAAGNDGKAMLNNANTTGLTAAGASHLVFVGSLTGLSTTKAGFSATAGTGALVTTTGVKTSYSANWLMTPGDTLVAPNTALSGNQFSYWSGTSFSAPMVSGSLILLESTWKILKTNGTAADLLFKTATNLGAASTYGNGELNLTKAFQPVGNLMVTQANGKQVAATTLTTSVVAGGALGPLSAVTNKLAAYTTFDSYTRNYNVNLSNLIATPTNKSAVATMSSMAPVPVVTRFDGGTLSAGFMAQETNKVGFAPSGQQAWYALTSTEAGTVIGSGYGFAFNNAFSTAFYGDTSYSFNSANLNVANGLLSLANGGNYFAYGSSITPTTRMAFSSVQTAPATEQSVNWATPSAKGMMVGMSTTFADKYLVGVSVGSLQEEHGVLGTNYDGNGAIAFGDNASKTIGVSFGYAMDANRSFLFEAAQSKTAGNNNVAGLTMGMSELISSSWGLSYTQKNTYRTNDSMTFALKAPMRVTSGSTALFSQGVDADTGVPFDVVEQVSLVPTGSEMDYKFSYTTPLGKMTSVSFDMSYIKDVNNIQDKDGGFIGLTYRKYF